MQLLPAAIIASPPVVVFLLPPRRGIRPSVKPFAFAARVSSSVQQPRRRLRPRLRVVKPCAGRVSSSSKDRRRSRPLAIVSVVPVRLCHPFAVVVPTPRRVVACSFACVLRVASVVPEVFEAWVVVIAEGILKVIELERNGVCLMGPADIRIALFTGYPNYYPYPTETLTTESSRQNDRKFLPCKTGSSGHFDRKFRASDRPKGMTRSSGYNTRKFRPEGLYYDSYVISKNSEGKVVAYFNGNYNDEYRTCVWVPKALVTNIKGPKLRQVWVPKSQA
uniref:OSJNBa0019K04.25 protein n=1 Tax=Oryza sativa subsp. japonica TaxID=39947 RepID=Q7XTX3_ORYSJ|nr:OSJNBa0019K04.25 [Oryza sativa Japonica Group]